LIKLGDGPAASTLINVNRQGGGWRPRGAVLGCSDLLAIEAPARPPEAPRLSPCTHGSTLAGQVGRDGDLFRSPSHGV